MQGFDLGLFSVFDNENQKDNELNNNKDDNNSLLNKRKHIEMHDNIENINN